MADLAEEAAETPPLLAGVTAQCGGEERRAGKGRQVSISSSVDVNEVEVEVEDDDPNDSGIESSGGNGGHPTLERGTSTGSEVFDLELADTKLPRFVSRQPSRNF